MSATGSNEFEMVEASMGNFSIANNELSGSLEALIRKNCKEEIALCTKLIISDTFCDIIEQIEEPKLIKITSIGWEWKDKIPTGSLSKWCILCIYLYKNGWWHILCKI